MIDRKDARRRERFARDYPDMAAAAFKLEDELGRPLTSAEMTAVGRAVRTGEAVELPTEPAELESLAAPAVPSVQEPEASAALNAEVAKYIRQGYAVMDRTLTQVVLQRRKRIGAARTVAAAPVAVVGGLLTVGALAAWRKSKKDTVVLTVDATGRVSKS
ncbi:MULTISPECIES: hypothetical protein [unclassified Microbacterium]|uniref:hypothetical protein n=1 Tax=unclassified Microbacterium TaxID=2609290 RepID=UPI00301804CD